MNMLVRAWKRSQQRPKVDTPDAVVIDGRKVQLEEKAMAERKKPQTDAVLDNSAPPEPNKVVLALRKSQFNQVIRAIKNAPIESVAKPLRHVTFHALKRLDVERDVSKAVGGIPKASDQVELGTIFKWAEKVTADDKKAVQQLVQIDATCVQRMK